MAYFKIVQDGNIVSCSGYFLKWNGKRNVLNVASADEAQFSPSLDEETIYHASWMRDVSNVPIPFETAEIIEISEEEYEEIKILLDGGETVPVPQDESEPEPEQEEEKTEHPMTIQEMRESIIALQEQNRELTEKINELMKAQGGEEDVGLGSNETGD